MYTQIVIKHEYVKHVNYCKTILDSRCYKYLSDIIICSLRMYIYIYIYNVSETEEATEEA